MHHIAMFNTAKDLAKFISRPQLAKFDGRIGEFHGSYAAELTLDGCDFAQMRDRVSQFGGLLVEAA